uniref:Aftiphilin clathrin-binding box domain-containing protein n=1 Tax=Tetraodon nigroviridis TaxID=99883 RepID=H3CAL7_TETNG
LSSRLERLFVSSFPQTAVSGRDRDQDRDMVSLRTCWDLQGTESRRRVLVEPRCPCRSVWTRLQDIHEAFGLRHQWGGSHCNKVLLSCLGIDTRNILFTGQKKQPVIVPMYAASLGMLEPTKEPVKPMSAAEMIASIAQTPPVAAEDSDSEALPPVQFDWSSSGLTNPLDGLDPELYELTTAKLD